MTSFIFTCEHASCWIPPEFRSLFRGTGTILRSHRGWDEGAMEVARGLSRKVEAPLAAGEHSRLLVDLNRTPDHPSAFSEFTRGLETGKRAEIVEKFHQPHWNKVRRLVKGGLLKGRVIHIGIHSFVPVFHGYRRPTRIGLLHDPARRAETEFAREWQKRLRKMGQRAVHRNLPYRGTGNGLVMALRKEFPAAGYLGFELELNQLCLRSVQGRREMISLLINSLEITK